MHERFLEKRSSLSLSSIMAPNWHVPQLSKNAPLGHRRRPPTSSVEGQRLTHRQAKITVIDQAVQALSDFEDNEAEGFHLEEK